LPPSHKFLGASGIQMCATVPFHFIGMVEL